MSQPTFDQFGNQVPPAQQDGEGIKALRKQYKEMKKQLEALQAENEQLKTSSRSGSVAEELARAGLDPRVAKFYPADRATTADAVAEWVDENRELFPSRQETAQQQSSQTTLTPDQQEGYRIMKLLGEAEAATQMDFKSRADACQTEEEFMALLDEFSDAHPFG
jgi:hypothetical protein